MRRLDTLRLVLVGVEGPVNLGMIARLCENFEVDELYLVNPVASIEEAREYAVRAAHRLDEAVVVDSLDNALRGTSISICTSAKTGREVLREPVPSWEAARIAVQAPGTVALVMGRESVGLTRQELSHCSLLAHILTSPRYKALNLANATAIMLYEIYKHRLKSAPAGETVDERLSRLVEAYTRALAASLVRDEYKRRDTVLAIRRLTAKNVASRREVEGLLYLLSRACRRIEGCEDEVRRYMQSGA